MTWRTLIMCSAAAVLSACVAAPDDETSSSSEAAQSSVEQSSIQSSLVSESSVIAESSAAAESSVTTESSAATESSEPPVSSSSETPVSSSASSEIIVIISSSEAASSVASESSAVVSSSEQAISSSEQSSSEQSSSEASSSEASSSEESSSEESSSEESSSSSEASSSSEEMSSSSEASSSSAPAVGCDDLVEEGAMLYAGCLGCHDAVPTDGTSIWSGNVGSIDAFDAGGDGYKPFSGDQINDPFPLYVQFNMLSFGGVEQTEENANKIAAYIASTVGQPWCPGEDWPEPPMVEPPVEPTPLFDIEQGRSDYEAMCEFCHGPNADQNELGSDDSFESIESDTDATMPFGNPGACTGLCATNIAAYLYQEVYNKPLP